MSRRISLHTLSGKSALKRHETGYSRPLSGGFSPYWRKIVTKVTFKNLTELAENLRQKSPLSSTGANLQALA